MTHASPAPAPPRAGRRCGLTLLELIVAAALMAGVTASLHVMLRGVASATDQLRGENDVLRHADAGLRFVTRRCRAAEGVKSLTGNADGDFTLDLGGGETLRFFRGVEDGRGVLRAHDSRHGEADARTAAEHVISFTPAFYEADGVTPTTDPARARVIDVTLTVDLPRDHAPGRTVRGRVWVRRW